MDEWLERCMRQWVGGWGMGWMGGFGGGRELWSRTMRTQPPPPPGDPPQDTPRKPFRRPPPGGPPEALSFEGFPIEVLMSEWVHLYCLKPTEISNATFIVEAFWFDVLFCWVGGGLALLKPFVLSIFIEKMNRSETQESHGWGFTSWVSLKPSKVSNAALIVEAF